MLNEKKVDVTDQIIGKMKNGEIQLLLGDSPIGKIKFPENTQIELLDHHFETDQQRIFQNITVTEGKDARYTDCDQGGWC
ncbi:YusG family protein [Metabacillus fastidiosus]|uniref:YusG family protein n=1 Tax=Metabacillus fastidiosus TaxID=1458 RepID=UPI003D2AA1CA